jgi:hypothetical protein
VTALPDERRARAMRPRDWWALERALREERRMLEPFYEKVEARGPPDRAGEPGELTVFGVEVDTDHGQPGDAAVFLWMAAPGWRVEGPDGPVDPPPGVDAMGMVGVLTADEAARLAAVLVRAAGVVRRHRGPVGMGP